MDKTIPTLFFQEIFEFLDHDSVLEFSLTCSSFFQLTHPFIEREFTFRSPLFSLKSDQTQNFLYIYKNAQKVVRPLFLDSTEFNLHTLPFSTTHLLLHTLDSEYLTYNLERLPSSITHLALESSSSIFLPLFSSLNKMHSLISLKVENSLLDFQNGFPPNLKKLKLSNADSPVNNLPPTITHLFFGNYFNQKVDNLPSTLTHLKFGTEFDQNISNLPQSLTHLTLNFGSTHEINRDLNLPKNLTHLCIKMKYIYSFVIDFPPNLIYLKVPSYNITAPLPCSIKQLHFTYMTSSFYKLCKYKGWVFENNINPISLEYCTSFLEDELPTSLQKLSIYEYEFNSPVDYLPPSLTHLTIQGTFNHPIDYLPSTLKYLDLCFSAFNSKADYLPPSLIVLKLGQDFNQPLDHLPKIEVLVILSDVFNYPLDHLPNSLKKLTLTSSLFNQPIDNLPSSLLFLHISSEIFQQPVDHLPPFLKKFILISASSQYNLYPLDNLPRSLFSLYFDRNHNLPKNLTFHHITSDTPSFSVENID